MGILPPVVPTLNLILFAVLVSVVDDLTHPNNSPPDTTVTTMICLLMNDWPALWPVGLSKSSLSMDAVRNRFCFATDPVEDRKDDLAHYWVAVPIRHFVIGKDLLKVGGIGLENVGL